MYQLEQNQGHTALVWNRSLYNYAQRIFPEPIVNLKIACKTERTKISEPFRHKLATSGIHLVQGGNPKVYNLSGKVIKQIKH